MSLNSIICESMWSYVAFHHHGSVLLTFVVGGVGEVDYSVQLTEQEINNICLMPSNAAMLVDFFTAEPEALKARQLAVVVWP